jgi:hypothetical protein
VKLEFFAKGELWEFDEVDGFAAVGFYDLVTDGQRLQFCVNY